MMSAFGCLEGLRGLMVATMLAALMSSLTSVFNSSSSIFTVDLWGKVRKKASQRELMLVGSSSSIFTVDLWGRVRRKASQRELMLVGSSSSIFTVDLWGRVRRKASQRELMLVGSSSSIFTVDLWGRVRKNASQRELMLVGRLFVLVMVGVGILWIPVVQAAQGGQLFDYIQSITSYQAPPVLACFTLGILWPRTNEPVRCSHFKVYRSQSRSVDGAKLGVGVPIVQAAQGGQLFDSIQSITSYKAPPVLACFTLGILWPGTNEPGAFWGMIIGLVVGTVRLILDFSYGFPRCGEPDNRPDIITRFHFLMTSCFSNRGAFWGMIIGLVVGTIRLILDFSYGFPRCGEPDNRPDIITKFHFLHFAILLFTLCIVATVVISLLTEPQDKEKLVRLTWWTRHNEEMPVDLSDSEGEEEGEETEKEENGELQLEVTEQDVQVQDGGQRGSRSMMGMIRTGWNWFCGFSDIPTKKQTKAEKVASLKVMTSLKEDRFWGRFVNITALVLMTIGIFFWGFFA
ncbi:SLC5A9 [Branchiostoma lanceolatum]|uniref:SLC5A9 protein n=1 Tax=Branchiostoma lanceolatum TaxID=7740 RepID=A0A8J9Z7Y8_BRALA|nr:SLC5A9 [Branchiostoma lanceolatum]